jgi:hypothetical protein
MRIADLVDEIEKYCDMHDIRMACFPILGDFAQIHSAWAHESIDAWKESYKGVYEFYPTVEKLQQRADEAIQEVEKLRNNESYPFFAGKAEEVIRRLRKYRDSIERDFPSPPSP